MEVCGDQWQVPPSHLKQELWRLRLVVLEAKARGRTSQEFLNDFSDHDYVSNDHQAGQRLQQLIVGQEARWYQICCHPYHQCN